MFLNIPACELKILGNLFKIDLNSRNQSLTIVQIKQFSVNDRFYIASSNELFKVTIYETAV